MVFKYTLKKLIFWFIVFTLCMAFFVFRLDKSSFLNKLPFILVILMQIFALFGVIFIHYIFYTPHNLESKSDKPKEFVSGNYILIASLTALAIIIAMLLAGIYEHIISKAHFGQYFLAFVWFTVSVLTFCSCFQTRKSN